MRRPGRPPKSALPAYAETRERLLRQGLATLTEKGFAAVSLDEILRAASVPKGSFYHYFDSKDAFGHALIACYAEYFATKLSRSFAASPDSALAGLRAFIADARAGMQRHAFKRGCLIGNLGQEMGTLPESFRAQLIAVLHDWQQRTTECLLRAQALHEIDARHDCARLATLFWTGWEGAVLRAKLERSPEPLDVFAQGFWQILLNPPTTSEAGTSSLS